MKIGVGVTVDEYIWQGHKYCSPLLNFDQTTIAKDKNKLIKELYDAGCDYIFIFDDDTFPVKSGWEDFFINAHLKTGVHHFVLCNENNGGLITHCDTGTGCLLFLTRKVIEVCGYMNPAYGKYGYEHCGYSLRINRAGLTPAWYVSVNGWQEYIYAWDLDKIEKHGFVKVPARTEEQRLELIAANEAEWNMEQNSSQIYYEN